MKPTRNFKVIKTERRFKPRVKKAVTGCPFAAAKMQKQPTHETADRMLNAAYIRTDVTPVATFFINF